MRGARFRQTLWLAPVISVVVLLFFATTSSAKDEIRIPRDHTLKIVGGVPYLMQSTYIWNPRRRGSGVDVAFSIHAYLPDLQPLGPTNKSLGDTVEGLDFMLQILLDKPTIPIADGFKNFNCIASSTGKLEEVILASCNPRRTATFYVLFKTSKFVGFVICNDMDAPATRCDLRAPHGMNEMLVSFPRIYLLDVHVILFKIEQLLDGFVSAADAARSGSL